jgi:hypothetical protein
MRKKQEKKKKKEKKRKRGEFPNCIRNGANEKSGINGEKDVRYQFSDGDLI